MCVLRPSLPAPLCLLAGSPQPQILLPVSPQLPSTSAVYCGRNKNVLSIVVERLDCTVLIPVRLKGNTRCLRYVGLVGSDTLAVDISYLLV